MTEILVDVARKAIDDAGGAAEVAALISLKSGRYVSRDQVQKWRVRGVSADWVHWLEKVTNKSSRQLRPDMFVKARAGG